MEDQWHWQERGTTWKGVGIYHLTMTVTDRKPVLGKIEIPENNPQLAYIKRTKLGNSLVECLLDLPNHYPEILVMSFCLMPNHLHAILRVTKTMPRGIMSVVRGFWQASKKLGREYTMSISLDTIQHNEHSGIYDYDPVFREMPFIRTLSRHGQLDAMINYVKDNPKRLATMMLMPGYFHVQHKITINGREYDAVGNTKLLLQIRRKEVHVRRIWVEDAELHGSDETLNRYMNECISAAKEGVLLVSPWISKYEKKVLQKTLQEGLPLIYLASNGFGDYYKPPRELFEACKAGKLLILSPWVHDPEKAKITREECVALNRMAEEIVAG